VPITLSSDDQPLPLEWLAFTAAPAAEAAMPTSNLTWWVTREEMNLGFEVERSTDGRTFSKIGFVHSQAPNPQATMQYTFTDAQPGASRVYYRLRQMDWDGRFTYSEVQEVRFGTPTSATEFGLQVFPNPASQYFTLVVPVAADQPLAWQLLDLTGRTHLAGTLPAGQTHHTQPTDTQVAKGTYILQMDTPTGSKVYQRIVLQ
jgi:hypothetical protein